MSRKRKAPKKIPIIDPKYKSSIIPKLINSIMYDGKKTIAEKIVYDAIEKIGKKSKDEPISVFNDAINNIRPTVEVRSRRVGGATYQVPVEVKSKRSQALALRWLIEASRKRKDKKMSDKIFNEIYDAYQNKGSAIKKRKTLIRWQSQIKHLLILGGKILWPEHIT
tara:strand:+ start:36 stop:533 length:498 start_codon:yes stop_codon:yes gene_type:complete